MQCALENHCTTTLISVLKIEVTEEQVSQTIKFIRPEPIEYTSWAQHSRNSTIGFVDKIIDERIISGWAMDKNSIEPIEIEIKVNGVIKAFSICNIHREDLEKIHPTGYCAFSVTLEESMQKGKDELEVIVKNSNISLLPSNGSVW